MKKHFKKRGKKSIKIKNALSVPLFVIENKDVPDQNLIHNGHTRLAAYLKIGETNK